MAIVATLCICGHPLVEHDEVDGCIEPTNRCQCAIAIELCPLCQHSSESHDGPTGQCTRIVFKTRQPCGCTQYPKQQQVEEGS